MENLPNLIIFILHRHTLLDFAKKNKLYLQKPVTVTTDRSGGNAAIGGTHYGRENFEKRRNRD